MSDDFELSTSAPLTSITWWGAPLLTPDPHFFSVIFSANVPASGGVPSHPGSTLSSTPFAQPGWGTGNPLYNSAPVSDPGDPVLFEKYTATFPTPISLQASTVYWLTIQADDFTLSENALNWGWHTRDYTIQDSLAPGDTLVGTAAGLPVYNFGGSALSQAYSNVGLAQGSPTALSYAPGTDGPAGIGAFGMGMAFALNAVPEPSTIVLAAMGGLALLACRWRNIEDAKHRPTAE